MHTVTNRHMELLLALVHDGTSKVALGSMWRCSEEGGGGREGGI